MPELPEVETVRRGLERLVVGKPISRLQILYPKMVKDVENLPLMIEGQTIRGMERRGKYLIFRLDQGLLLSHLRMEGKYLYEKGALPANKHVHLLFHFTDQTTLQYQDVRKFGTLEYLPESELAAYFQRKKLGPEPKLPDFDLKEFEHALKKSNKPIKSALLDQTLVAGLGNIYVDEVLYRAAIHPLRSGSSLKKSEVKALHSHTIAVLALAVERGGSTIRTYRNALGEDGSMQEELKVYGKTDQACPRCGHSIQKIKVGGRGTHFCPQCQKE